MVAVGGFCLSIGSVSVMGGALGCWQWVAERDRKRNLSERVNFYIILLDFYIILLCS